jgi:hypothetical protein
VRLTNGEPLPDGLLRGWLMGGADSEPIIDGPGGVMGTQEPWKSALSRLARLYNESISQFVTKTQNELLELQDSWPEY